MAEPKYKGQYMYIFDLASDVNINITMPDIPIDKIRFTLFDTCRSLTLTPARVWCDLVNNYIGTLHDYYIGSAVGAVSVFQKPLKPLNGMEFWLPKKMFVDGSMNLKLDYIDGTTLNTPTGSCGILIETFAY